MTFTIDVLPSGLSGSVTLEFGCQCQACRDEQRRLAELFQGAQP